MLAHHPPASSLEWVQTLRSNVFSLLIRCLSAKDEKIHEASLGLLARVWKSVEVRMLSCFALCQGAGMLTPCQLSDMQEKQHALYIFNLLKNLIKPSSDGPPLRLPSYASLILSHALRGVFYPSNFIYPRTARFLLQRPELDVTDVPMLYGMLYGSSDDWRKERGWIVRFLPDGMMSTEDFEEEAFDEEKDEDRCNEYGEGFEATEGDDEIDDELGAEDGEDSDEELEGFDDF
jgi:nucleolar pre-ribosomal-associated protein 1